MAKKILKARANKSKEGFRSELNQHEIALIAELIELYGARGAAARFA